MLVILSAYSSDRTAFYDDPPVEWEDFAGTVLNWTPWCDMSWVYREDSVPHTNQTIADLMADGYQIVGRDLDDQTFSALMTQVLNEDTNFHPGDSTPAGFNSAPIKDLPPPCSVLPGDIYKEPPEIPGILDAFLPEGPVDPPDPGTVEKTEHGWSIGINADIDLETREKIKAFLLRNKGTFAYKLSDLVGYSGKVGPFMIAPPGTEVVIPPSKPLRKARRRGPMEKEQITKHMMPNYDAGFIKECDAAVIIHEIVVAAKRDADGGWSDVRVCVDYGVGTGGVNAYTNKDPYPLPNPDVLYDEVDPSHNVFSLCDLKSGFFQCPIPPHLQHLTAFYWDRDGMGPKAYCWTVAPFGCSGMPSHFQRIMDAIITEAGLGKWCRAYLDDVLTSTSSIEEHMEILQRLFDAFKSNGMRLHPSKSLFFASQVDFLGFQISQYGRKPSEAKVAAIRALPTPKDVHTLRRVIGFCSFYRDFTPNFTKYAHSLYALLQKDSKWEWTAQRDKDWEALKDELCKEGNALRRADPTKPYILHTDWSHYGLSAVLNQIGDDGKEYLVACASRSCNKAESSYSSWKGELLAVVFGLRTFRYYLLGSKFPTTLWTDHKGLVWLMGNKDLEGQYQRWQVILSAYDVIIKYKKGSTHELADVPSRFPLATTVDRTGAREPDVQPPPIKVDISDLTPDEKERALVELAEHNAVAAFTLLTRALCDSAQLPDTFTTVPPHTPREYDNFSANNIYKGLFTSAALHDLDALAQRTAMQLGDDPLASLCTSMEQESHTSLLSHGFYGDPDEGNPIALARISTLHRSACDHVDLVATQLQNIPVPLYPTLTLLAPDEDPANAEYLTGRVATINANSLPQASLDAALSDGMYVMELFGGMCGGLQMLLDNGFKIQKYLYCDSSPEARTVAEHRIMSLHAQYPHQFPYTAWQDAFSLPQDVYQITPTVLSQVGCANGRQWCLVAGFECQDLSMAGQGRGLAGSRSKSFFPMLQILGEMQAMQKDSLWPMYFIENTFMRSRDGSTAAVREAFDEICFRIGSPVLLDAARVNSYAHRLRYYWQNVCSHIKVQTTLDTYDRDPSLQLTDILEPGRYPQTCTSVNGEPWYPANAIGAPIRVLPTLVSYLGRTGAGSHAFRNGGPGMVLDTFGRLDHPPCLSALTIEERELALGYPSGCTDAPFLADTPEATYAARHRITGCAFDANAVRTTLAVALAIRLSHSASIHSHSAIASELGGEPAEEVPFLNPFVSDSEEGVSSQTTATESQAITEILTDGKDFLHYTALNTIAEVEEKYLSQGVSQSADVWHDSAVLSFLQTNELQTDDPREKDRVTKRSKAYCWAGGTLQRKMNDGSMRSVPAPADRIQIVRDIHEQCGHWGRRRTTHLVLQTYWFSGLYKMVRDIVRTCSSCGREKAIFTSIHPTLQSVPVRGLLYRWGLDTAGPFAPSARGHTYFLICIEHFSKFIEVFPLKSKSSSEVAYHFLHGIVSRYGACAEVITDGGGEFEGAFADLLLKCLIDHRVTSASHPQANGLSEKCVGSVKSCLARYVDTSGSPEDWDLYLPWIALGYRATPQESTKYTPFQLMYSADCITPPNIKERFQMPIDFDNLPADELAASLQDRADAMQRSCAMVHTNLLVAQHRDSLRYARLRSGSYNPKVLNFQKGDYVYLKDLADALHPTARREILRVKDVRSSGVLVLEGQCGNTIARNGMHCTPCHLDIEQPQVTDLARPHTTAGCEKCRLPDAKGTIVCDSCNRVWHIYCLTPPLARVPRGDWLCSDCKQSGVDIDTLRTARAELYNARAKRQTAQRAGRLTGKLPTPMVASPILPPQPQLWPTTARPSTDTAQRTRPLADFLPPTPKAGLRGRKAKKLSAAAAASTMLLDLTQVYDWSQAPCILDTLSSLMPGEWPKGDLVTDLRRHISLSPDPMQPVIGQSDSIPSWAITVLLEQANFAFPNVVDLSSGHDSVDALWDQIHSSGTYVSPSFITSTCNLLHPLSLHQLACQFRSHLIVTCPRLLAIDLIVPLMVTIFKASNDLALWVPMSYFSTAPRPRTSWLHQLASAGRAVILRPTAKRLLGFQPCILHEPYVWFMIFSDHHHKWTPASFRHVWDDTSPLSAFLGTRSMSIIPLFNVLQSLPDLS